MSLLSELKTVADACSIPVETGVFSSVPPDLYLVITPMADTFELHADNSPGYDTQEARLSLFVKGSYTAIKDTLVRALLGADFCITDRRYIAHEDDTGFHHHFRRAGDLPVADQFHHAKREDGAEQNRIF